MARIGDVSVAHFNEARHFYVEPSFDLMGETGFLIVGVRKLRTASIISLVSTALGTAAFISLLISVRTFSGRYTAPHISLREVLNAFIRHAALGITLIAASGLLGLIATFCFLIPAVLSFARWRGELDTLSKVVKYGFWGAFILGVIALASLASWFHSVLDGSAHPGMNVHELLVHLLGSSALAGFALFLAFLGWVGFLIILDRLRALLGVEEFRSAVIVMIAYAALLAIPIMYSAPAVASASLNVLASIVQMSAWYLVLRGASKVAEQQLRLAPASTGDQQGEEKGEEEGGQQVADFHSP